MRTRSVIVSLSLCLLTLLIFSARLSAQTTSPDGTTVPLNASQIIDNAGTAWTIGAGGAILRNGSQAAYGWGSQIVFKNSMIYVLGGDSKWWQWTGGWTNVGSTIPGGTTSGGGAASPDGTTIPLNASQIVDSAGAVWTIGSGGAILLNGSQAAYGWGSQIAWKNSTIYVLGGDSKWWQWTGSGWVNVGSTVPGVGGTNSGVAAPSATAVGPQSTITCPAGAVNVFPGASIQNAVNTYGGNTTFCLRSGVFYLNSAITPKTGNTFVGEYGAVLDGSSWSTSDDTQGAFRAHNQDIDYVTIRNLVIRNMPQSGIHTYYWMSDHWTIEYNEIAYTKIGIEFSPNFTIRNNYIHHNAGDPSSSNPALRGGGYVGIRADNSTFDSNEIAYNGPEQKVGLSTNVAFRNNFVHHNLRDGIWYDTNSNAGAVIDANRVEDNARIGIVFESSVGATITNNTIRRNAGDGVLISMSQNAQIYSNTLDSNFGGIEYFLNCDSLSLGEDVKNNTAHDNTVVVGTQSYTYASGFTNTASCTATQLAPYVNGSKSLTFSRNAYRVPSLSIRYFLWPGWKFWSEWQAMGQDAGGSLSQ